MLPTLLQRDDMPAGDAFLRCPGLELNPADVEISFAEPLASGGQRYLDPRDTQNPWAGAEFWMRPISVTDAPDGAVLLRLDQTVTYYLKPNRPYLLGLRDASGAVVRGHVLGTALRLPSSPPAGWVGPSLATPLPQEQGIEPAVEPPQPLVSPPPETPEPEALKPETPKLEAAPSAPVTTQEKSSALLYAALGLLGVIMAGGGWWFLQGRGGEPVAQATAQPAPRTLAVARAALADNINAETSRTLGEAHLAAKDFDGAFLLFRAAAEKGDLAAHLAMGGFYDPASWRKESSPLPSPNADQAAHWFRRAAEKGDAEGQYRLGMVLKSGKTEQADGPEQAVSWLTKAAAQGHAKAKEALGQ